MKIGHFGDFDIAAGSKVAVQHTECPGLLSITIRDDATVMPAASDQ